MNKNNIILCFCKHPKEGLVKSRLAKDLGTQRATEIYKILLDTTIQNISNFKSKIILYCYPNTKHPVFINYRNKYSLKLENQRGGDIGIKMYQAIKDYLGMKTNVVLIGSDCLEIDATYIQNAFEKLSLGNEMVLGPTVDGGYALIGINKLNISIFQDISWGSNQVLKQTKEKASKLNWNVGCLPIIRDLDLLDDYKYFSNHKKYSHLF